jgi:4-hydroxy-3-polyprenylbenzoate decarboxylase
MDAFGGKRDYRDLEQHIEELKARDLLYVVDEPVNKDTEMSALVRWQFRGGLREADRKAFLFNNITDSKGRKYDIPVVIGALAANQDIYATGMDTTVDNIAAKWDHAIANPVPPRLVNEAPCHDVIIEGQDLLGEEGGLVRLPIPLSTPGFDSTPTLAATNVITRNPDTGTQNMGTYRAGLKASDRLVVRMATRVGGAEGRTGNRRLYRHRFSGAGRPVRRKSRPRRAGGIESTDEGDCDHASEERSHPVLYIAGSAVRKFGHQADRL